MTRGSSFRNIGNGYRMAAFCALFLCLAMIASCGTIRTTTAPDGTITRTVDEEALGYQIEAGQWILYGCDGICATLAATGGLSPSSYAAYQRISEKASCTLDVARCALQNYQALKNGANEQAMGVAFSDLVRIILRLTAIYRGQTTELNSAT